eukprot:217089_1
MGNSSAKKIKKEAGDQDPTNATIVPTPVPRPTNFLQELKNKTKQTTAKQINTTIRTRDGKVYTETIGTNGTISRQLQTQAPVVPQYLALYLGPTTKQLPSYIYSESDKKWIGITHETKEQKDDAQHHNRHHVKELVIVSYNIWFADQQWQERQQKLLSMLEEINPDIVCLQEVTPRFLVGFCDNKYIQNNFELTDQKESKCSTVSPYGVMIGCNRNKNKLSMIDVKISALATNMRRSLVSSCLQLNGDQTLWINTVHLESLMNADVRVHQLNNIFNFYMNDQGDAMLMGDFNFGDAAQENDCISKEFVDCWLEYKNVLIANTAVDSSNKFSFATKLRGNTCFGSRYDRMLLRSDQWNVDSFEIIGKEMMPSDHLGIVTTLIAK